MIDFVNKALLCQFTSLPKSLRQHLRKSGIIFIDFHQDPYYGESENPDVRKSKVKRSTSLFYEYLTADTYSRKGCFTIALIHRTPDEGIFPLMEQLLERVEKVITPKILVFDGEFAILDILALLSSKNIKYLARKSRSPKVKEHLEKYYGTPEWKNDRKWRSMELRSKRSRVKKVKVEICPQNVQGEMKALVKSPGWTISPQYADHLYKKRFNIETGYRDKHRFQLFTKTKILSTRLLIILFAALLWNCWQSFLTWMRMSKHYSKNLPRKILITLTSTWVKFILRKMLDS